MGLLRACVCLCARATASAEYLGWYLALRCKDCTLAADFGMLLVSQDRGGYLPFHGFLETGDVMSLASIDDSLLQENTLRAFSELRFEDAVRMLEPQVFRRPDPELFSNLGALYFQLGWAREAEAALVAALKLDPLHPTAVLNLAEHYINHQLPWAALRTLERAAQRAGAGHPWQAELLSLRSQLLARRVSVCVVRAFAPVQASESLQARGERLQQLLHNLFDQSYPIFEILLPDEPSLREDMAALKLPEAWRQKLKLLPHAELPGRQSFANGALKRCGGEYFVQVHDQHRFEPTWLERAMMHLENPEVAAVGTRFLASEPHRLLSRWMSQVLPREQGPRQLKNPALLGDVGGVYRVSTLKRVGGWNGRWGVLHEELERGNRLMEAGFTLRYESSALVRDAQSPSLAEALAEIWRLRCLNRMEALVFDRLERTAACLEQNRTMALKSMAALLTADQVDLLYFSFLKYFAWCAFDLAQVQARAQVSEVEVSQTAAAFYLMTRHLLHETLTLPGRVIERLLVDLRELLNPLLRSEEQAVLGPEAVLLEAVEELPLSREDLLEALERTFPQASVVYLRASADERFLAALGKGMGALLERSVERLEEEEAIEQLRREKRPHYVLFNPPARGFGGGRMQGYAASARWLHPSRLDRFVAQRLSEGACVSRLDAVALKLDARLTEQTLLGLKPDVVVFSAKEGGIERIAAAARRLKLVAGADLRLVLIHGGELAELPLRRHYAMLDEIYADEWPDEKGRVLS